MMMDMMMMGMMYDDGHDDGLGMIMIMAMMMR
jgi:hypothetical protein